MAILLERRRLPNETGWSREREASPAVAQGAGLRSKERAAD